MPRDLDEEPSEDSIRELYQWNETHWGPQRSLDDILKKLILEQHVVLHQDTNNPERLNRLEPERVTLGEGPRTVDVIASLYSLPPTLGVMWIGEGSRSPAKADDVEIGLNELMDQLNPPTDAPRKRQRIQMIALGREAGIYLPGHTYWWDAPRKKTGQTEVQAQKERDEWRRKAPIPILWRDLPAESTFPPSFGSVNDLALSTLTTTWYELEDIFSEEELAGARPENWKEADKYKEIMLGIFANRAWVSYAVLAHEKSGMIGRRGYADKILRTIEHKMDRCPIRILPGRTSAWKEPGEFWRSALHTVRAQIPQLDRRASEASTASRSSVMPWLKACLHRNEDVDGTSRIKKMLQGDLADLETEQDGQGREDIQAIHIPPFGEQNIALMQFQRDTIRGLTGTPDVLSGQEDPGSGPAWSLNYTAEQAKSFHRETTEAVIAAEIDHAETLIACINSFGEVITLQRHDEDGGSITLDPEELGKWSPILKGEYRLQTPVNEIAMIQTAINVMQIIEAANLPIDLFYVMEKYLDMEQPFEMFKRSEVTKFLRSPEMARWRTKILLEEADVELQGDEWVSPEDFEQQYAGRIPPEMAEFARQKMGGGALGPEAMGARRAGSPGAAQPGGQRPQLVAPR